MVTDHGRAYDNRQVVLAHTPCYDSGSIPCSGSFRRARSQFARISSGEAWPTPGRTAAPEAQDARQELRHPSILRPADPRDRHENALLDDPSHSSTCRSRSRRFQPRRSQTHDSETPCPSASQPGPQSGRRERDLQVTVRCSAMDSASAGWVTWFGQERLAAPDCRGPRPGGGEDKGHAERSRYLGQSVTAEPGDQGAGQHRREGHGRDYDSRSKKA